MIEITYLIPGKDAESYLIERPEQARDRFDQEVADLAILRGEDIKMGCVVAHIIGERKEEQGLETRRPGELG